MLKSSLLSVLAASTVAYAQFALKIVKPVDQEFLQLDSTFSVEIQAPNITAGTQGPNIQLSFCTEITGLPLCNHTMGTILVNEPFNPPDQTYSVTIPENQKPGLTRLIAGHIIDVDGTPTLTDPTSIEVFLGSAGKV